MSKRKLPYSCRSNIITDNKLNSVLFNLFRIQCIPDELTMNIIKYIPKCYYCNRYPSSYNKCKECSKTLCKDCIINCFDCNKIYCYECVNEYIDKHIKLCKPCYESPLCFYCGDHGIDRCVDCKYNICVECISSCCATFCRKCVKYCQCGKNIICDNCSYSCDYCYHGMCGECYGVQRAYNNKTVCGLCEDGLSYSDDYEY